MEVALSNAQRRAVRGISLILLHHDFHCSSVRCMHPYDARVPDADSDVERAIVAAEEQVRRSENTASAAEAAILGARVEGSRSFVAQAEALRSRDIERAFEVGKGMVFSASTDTRRVGRELVNQCRKAGCVRAAMFMAGITASAATRDALVDAISMVNEAVDQTLPTDEFSAMLGLSAILAVETRGGSVLEALGNMAVECVPMACACMYVLGATMMTDLCKYVPPSVMSSVAIQGGVKSVLLVETSLREIAPPGVDYLDAFESSLRGARQRLLEFPSLESAPTRKLPPVDTDAIASEVPCSTASKCYRKAVGAWMSPDNAWLSTYTANMKRAVGLGSLVASSLFMLHLSEMEGSRTQKVARARQILSMVRFSAKHEKSDLSTDCAFIALGSFSRSVIGDAVSELCGGSAPACVARGCASDAISLPCAHSNTCSECVMRMMSSSPKSRSCAICRCPIRRLVLFTPPRATGKRKHPG